MILGALLGGITTYFLIAFGLLYLTRPRRRPHQLGR
jgi:hypothetical protein